MIRKTLSVAVATGLVAGLVIAAVLQFTTTPLILKAETYERAAHAAMEGKSVRVGVAKPGSLVLSAHSHPGTTAAGAATRAPDAPGAPHHEDTGWQPTEGLQRTAATSVAAVAVAIGYALLLLGCMTLARELVTPQRGLLWGLAGFAAVGLAPALGLAPELPGSAAGDLLQRQIWWVATALATGIGLFLLLRLPQMSGKAAGAALLAAPHLFGAPRSGAFESTAPAELAASFAATSLVVHALLWCLVGLGVGWFWNRLSPDMPRPVPS